MSRNRDLNRQMRSLIQERLLPAFHDRGFEFRKVPGIPLNIGYSPFGFLRRVRGMDHDLADIQLRKDWTPRFVINLGRAPPEGIVTPWGVHIPQDEMTGDNHHARVYPRSGSLRWFGPGFLTLRKERALRKSIEIAVAAVVEVDEWFLTGKVGPHIHIALSDADLERQRKKFTDRSAQKSVGGGPRSV